MHLTYHAYLYLQADFDNIYYAFNRYKLTIPVYGAILLDSESQVGARPLAVDPRVWHREYNAEARPPRC